VAKSRRTEKTEITISTAATTAGTTGSEGPVRITVPFDPHLLCANRTFKMPPWRKGQLIRASKEAALSGWTQAGCPAIAGQVRVSLIVRRGRRMDDDAAWEGTKWARDALFVGRVTPDDSPRWVRLGGVEQETGARWRERPETVFVIEAVEEG